LQPTRKRAKTTGDAGGFDPGFDFGQFNQDIWAEKLLATTSKKNKKTPLQTSLDDKIKKRQNGEIEEVEIKEESSEEEVSSEDEPSDEIESDDSMSGRQKSLKRKRGQKRKGDDDDIDLSEDELKQDALVVKDKGKKGKKKGKKVADEEEVEEEKEEVRLEDDPDYVFETDMSFQQMNLSRPLLKVC